MSDKRTCPVCHGYGEVMYREKLIDSDGSEDIGATPEVRGCSRCNGEGEVDPYPKPKKLTGEELKKYVEKLRKEGKI